MIIMMLLVVVYVLVEKQTGSLRNFTIYIMVFYFAIVNLVHHKEVEKLECEIRSLRSISEPLDLPAQEVTQEPEVRLLEALRREKEMALRIRKLAKQLALIAATLRASKPDPLVAECRSQIELMLYNNWPRYHSDWGNYIKLLLARASKCQERALLRRREKSCSPGD